VSAAPSAADQFESDQTLARQTHMEAVPQTGAAASALKAIIPTVAWPAFARRAEEYCDHLPPARETSPPCA